MGNGFPDETEQKKIAEFFFPLRGEDQDLLLEKFSQIRTSAPPALDPTRRDIPIRFGIFEVPPFADYRREEPPGSRGFGFLDRLLGRVVRLADLRLDDSLVTEGIDSSLIEKVRDNRLHLGVGIYDVLDRADLITISSNGRMGMNGVVLENDPQLDLDGKGMKQTLHRLDLAVSKGEKFPGKPLVLNFPAEIGNAYVRNVLGIRNPLLILDAGTSVESAIQALIEGSKAGHGPILFTDEWSALEVIVGLKNRGHHGMLAFPLSTEQSAKRIKAHLPAYSIGLVSGSKQQKEFLEYASRLLTLFLRNETEFVVSQVKTLYEDIRTEIRVRLDSLSQRGLDLFKERQNEPCRDLNQWKTAIAARCARYLSRLNDAEITYGQEYLSLPWQPILRRALRDIGPLSDELSDPSAGRIKLGVRPFEPFVSLKDRKPSGFLEQILRPIQALVDLEDISEIRSFSSQDESNRSEGLLGSSTQDVRIGWFATPLRAANWRLFRLPVRVPLNIYFRDFDFPKPENLTRLKAAFRAHPNDAFPQDFEPIVLQSGSAAEYLENTLGVPGSQVRNVMELNPLRYLELLNLPPKKQEKRIVLVDMFTCLSILGQSKPVSGHSAGRLLCPLTEDDRTVPTYHLCIAVAQNSGHWIEFFDKNWATLIEANSIWFEGVFTTFHDDIKRIVHSHLKDDASRKMIADDPGLSVEHIAHSVANRVLMLDEDEHELQYSFSAADLMAWRKLHRQLREMK